MALLLVVLYLFETVRAGVELSCFAVWPSNAEAGQSGTIEPYFFTPDEQVGIEGK